MRQKEALRNASHTPSRSRDEVPEPTRPELEQAVAEWQQKGGEITVLTPQPFPKFEEGEPIPTVHSDENGEGRLQFTRPLHQIPAPDGWKFL